MSLGDCFARKMGALDDTPRKLDFNDYFRLVHRRFLLPIQVPYGIARAASAPCRSAPKGWMMDHNSNPSSPERKPAQHRLLIVDDVLSVREALRWAIEAVEDMVVVGEASDGIEALALAAALKPTVVILDVQLPGMDGFEVAERLRLLADPPAIIFLSVRADPDSRQRGAAVGGYAFVEKGAGWQVLVDLIREALGSR